MAGVIMRGCPMYVNIDKNAVIKKVKLLYNRCHTGTDHLL